MEKDNRTEAQLETSLRSYARKKGCLFIKLRGVAGIPDRMIVGPTGKILFLELKSPKARTKPSELQMHWLKKLTKFGQVARWTNNEQIARGWIDEVL